MKNAPYLKYVFLVITIFYIQSQCKIYAQNLESSIDSLLNAKYLSNEPGAVFLISKDGNIIYNKAFGVSNLELNVAMNNDNVFEIGSMTKQFTAVSILILMEEGKLNLDDEITKLIPDYPTNGSKITIHHLLTHTSGIKDFTSVDGLNEISKNDLTPSELVDFFSNESTDFQPGEKFKYCNSGYILLGYIIESVSGMTYADFVEKYIFEKLNMSASQYASHREVIHNRASGYDEKEAYVNTRYISFSLPYSSGSLMSSVGDMFIWQEAIKNNILISPESTEKAFTNHTLNNGEFINYGYGWHIRTLNGEASFEHGGSIFGFKSMAIYLPESDIYVIGLNNCGCNSPTKITKKIAELTAKNEGL
jgi:CubicO group peptidase (beta-lactamase class C family)